MLTQTRDVKQPNNSKLTLQVMNDLTVQVLPHTDHEFLMTTKEVANGYGTSEYVVRKAKERHGFELVEGKHYITAGTFCHGDLNLPHNAVLWTKRGIVRLGFFIKSERAKLFRDWAEELIITIDEQRDLFGAVVPQKTLPQKRKHNRITPARMVEILADVAKIEDKELRLSLISKLGV